MYFKNWAIIICFLLIFSFLPGCGGSKQAQPQNEKTGKRENGKTSISYPVNQADSGAAKQKTALAIYPFEISGKSKLSGDQAVDLITAELTGIEGYRIIDRASLKKVISEVGFSGTEFSDPAYSSKIGKLVGAQIYCFGNINKELGIITAKIVHIETGEQLSIVKVTEKNEIKGLETTGKKLKEELKNIKLPASEEISSGTEEPDELKGEKSIVTVEVIGYGAVVDGDFAMAKEIALKDAYSRAIEKGCGVKLIRATQVENFQLVRDAIITESVGYVTSYDIVNENPKSEYGYEVTVKAGVSQQPMTDIDKLKLMVKYLLAEPRVVVLIDGQMRGEDMKSGAANLIAGQLSSVLQKAGFSVVDAKTIEEKKKELLTFNTNEDAARLAGMLNANVIVQGSISTDITTRVQGIDFPIISARTNGVIKIILAETASIVSILDDSKLPAKVGQGNTEEGAARNSLNGFVQDSGSKLAWELAARLGDPIMLRLTLRNVSLAQANQLLDELQKLPKHLVIEAGTPHYVKNVADYQIKTSVKSMAFLQKLLKLVPASTIGGKEFVPEKVEFSTVILELKS